MLNPSRLRDHGAEKSRLLAHAAGLHVGPVEGASKYAKARRDECDQNDFHRHRSNSIWLIDAIMLDVGLQALISIKRDRTLAPHETVAGSDFRRAALVYDEDAVFSGGFGIALYIAEL
jgi:hypothetical protein